jgi:hypothetical protein
MTKEKKERILLDNINLINNENYELFHAYFDKHYNSVALSYLPPELIRSVYDLVVKTGKVPTTHKVAVKMAATQCQLDRLDKIFEQKCALEREEAEIMRSLK